MLLNASGGSLKGIKCFGYLFDFGWHADGSWYYIRPDFDLRITLPDSTTESIALLDPSEALVTLGVATCPTGISPTTSRLMRSRARNGAL